MMFPGMKRLPKTKVNEQPETDSAPAIMMPIYGLSRALSVNQFKNAFDYTSEPGVGRKSDTYMEKRKKAERGLFGTPPGAPAHKRPLYGYLDDKTDSFSGHLQDLYGDTNVHIKWPEPGQRVTTTLGDSLNNYGDKNRDEKFSPEPLDPDKHRVVKGAWHDSTYVPYREVQWHDHPSPREDITQVQLAATSVGNMSTPTLYPARDIAHSLARHKELADTFRAAGLPHTTPVISKISYDYKEPTLFDAHPDEETRNKFSNETERRTETREL